MASYNRIIMVGNLTRDPELKYTSGGTALCKFGIATSRQFKRKNGESGEEVCFVTCVAWGKAGELITQYMKKGSQILVEGRLTFSTWQGKDDQKHSKHEISVENFTFLGRPKSQTDSPPTTREQEESQEQESTAGIDETQPGNEEDEVPF